MCSWEIKIYLKQLQRLIAFFSAKTQLKNTPIRKICMLRVGQFKFTI